MSATDSSQTTESESGKWRIRHLEATSVDDRLRLLMIVATVLVIPDLILEEQPLRASWHGVAVVFDWLIWLVFLVELAAIMLLARDWRAWLRRYPLAPVMLILTPPLAPVAIQGLRAFRLLRLLRVARGFQLFSRLLTLEGLKYVIALAVFLIVGGGTIFADVENSVGNHVSTWDGIWWAIGTVSTTGSQIEVKTDAGRAIAIVLMLTGISTFSILTGAISQHFIAHRAVPRIDDLSQSENAILIRLDELSARLERIEPLRTSVAFAGAQSNPASNDLDRHSGANGDKNPSEREGRAQ